MTTTPHRPLVPQWWTELAAVADQTADRYTATWYEQFRVLHGERFPDADVRTRENLQAFAESAALHERLGDSPSRFPERAS